MDTENKHTMNDEQFELIDSVLLKSERVQCVLGLVADAMTSSELLPAIKIVIDQMKDIDSTLAKFNNL